MWRIYNAARIVTVWLGDLSDDADVAMYFLDNYLDCLLELENHVVSSRDPLEQHRLSKDDRFRFRWRALFKLLQRPWFTRCWIIQEVSTATKVEITCGGE